MSWLYTLRVMEDIIGINNAFDLLESGEVGAPVSQWTIWKFGVHISSISAEFITSWSTFPEECVDSSKELFGALKDLPYTNSI